MYYFNTTVLNKFKTTIPNTPFTQKFLNDYAGKSASEQENMQATNYMLDQIIWSEYMSTSGRADYAFGGPTLPLFQASYNDICKATTRMGVQKKENGTGYQVNKGGGSWGEYQTGYADVSTQKGLFVLGTGHVWFASPSSAKNSAIMIVASNGGVGYAHYYLTSSYCGGYGQFRPIVSLKTNVVFTDNGNGTYTIN